MTAAWASSNRRAELPSNWGTIVKRIKRRDGHRCTWVERGQRCLRTSHLEVDHHGDKHDHRDHNLRTLCSVHHLEHTQTQAATARAALPTRTRPTATQHPGLKST